MEIPIKHTSSASEANSLGAARPYPGSPTRHTEADRAAAHKFAAKLYKELGRLCRAIILFGSVAEREERPIHPTPSLEGDIDVMVVLDDVAIVLTDEIVTGYRVIAEQCARQTSSRLHITTVNFTTFWEYARVADPVIVNVLRTGIPMIDTGFVEPLQTLLRQGRIRPTEESVWSYYLRAPQSLQASQMRLMQGALDLYWACIDAAHAAVMAAGEVPTSPKHAAELLRTLYVERGLLEEEYAKTMEQFYQLGKDLIHRRINTFSAEYYDHLYVQAKAFVDRMKEFLPHRHGMKE